jgi:hypothetical protein
VAIGAHTYDTAMVLFARINVADAAALSLGQYRCVFESGYRKVEWAVLNYLSKG